MSRPDRLPLVSPRQVVPLLADEFLRNTSVPRTALSAGVPGSGAARYNEGALTQRPAAQDTTPRMHRDGEGKT
jgi:hypothetical protein